MAIDHPYNPHGSRFFSPTGAPNADGSPRIVGPPRTIGFTAMALTGLAAMRCRDIAKPFGVAPAMGTDG